MSENEVLTEILGRKGEETEELRVLAMHSEMIGKSLGKRTLGTLRTRR
jgi:hypothetical protein